MGTATIGNITVGADHPLLIISGPCVIESRDQALMIAEFMKQRCEDAGLNFVFKGSFDKANRSSISSARGPGMDEGLEILSSIGRELGVPTTTDIHESSQAASIGQAVDLIQVPAFLCRQTDLLVASAATGKAVNVKKGQFMSPAEMQNVVTKLESANASSIMLTERGTFFGYNRLVNDFIGVADMMEMGPPVCFDATHSTQQPGGQTTSSGGRPERAPMLAKAAVVAGVDAVFIETHPDPPNAMSDAATVLPLQVSGDLVGVLARLREAAK